MACKQGTRPWAFTLSLPGSSRTEAAPDCSPLEAPERTLPTRLRALAGLHGYRELRGRAEPGEAAVGVDPRAGGSRGCRL